MFQTVDVVRSPEKNSVNLFQSSSACRAFRLILISFSYTHTPTAPHQPNTPQSSYITHDWRSECKDGNFLHYCHILRRGSAANSDSKPGIHRRRLRQLPLEFRPNWFECYNVVWLHFRPLSVPTEQILFHQAFVGTDDAWGTWLFTATHLLVYRILRAGCPQAWIICEAGAAIWVFVPFYGHKLGLV